MVPCENPKCPCSLMSPLVIPRGLLATSSFVESQPLVSSFANVIGVLLLLQASEFYHVRLMKASPKLPFIVVIVIFSILFSSRCSCLFFVESLLYTQQNIYQNIDLLKCLWNYLSNEWSFILNRVIHLKPSPNEGVKPVSLLALRVVQKFSECTTFNVLAIPACRNLRLTWFLICWNGNFVDLLNIQNMLLFASEVELDIDENNIFLWIHPKMSMISIMWSLEHSVVHP